MEIFILLKGYDYEGYGSDVEVFATLQEAEARKQQYKDGPVWLADDHVEIDYDYDSLKIVKRIVK